MGPAFLWELEAMSIASEAGRLARLTEQVGKAALHHLYPDEFEYYATALELLDGQGQQVAYLLFPIMPDSITITEPQLTTIKKTAGGLVSLHNPTYAPREVGISGTFGRRLRLLILGAQVDVGSAFVSGSLAAPGAGGGASLKALGQDAVQGAKEIAQSFSYSAKTGYGTVKILEKIVHLAKQLDAQGNPHQLYFYNLAFNQQDLVEVSSVQFSQSMEKNMMWGYNLAFRTMAPAAAVRGAAAAKASVVQTLAVDVAQRGITTASRILGDLATRTRSSVLTLSAPTI